ncbi:MAG: DUF167 domain-containing protein [Candidatus Mucispirillum faecigallinarum]|nr:DUF167 domain-containing protein [Candidatus Mucispirillum faecigallinarum]
MKIKVYIQPNSKKSGYAGLYDGIPKLKITAPPVDGAANSEIIKIFSKLLNIPKSDITISSGQASRLKILEINTNKTCEEITALLENF